MDVSALDAIDAHTHVHRSVADSAETGAALEAMAAYFKTDAAAYTVDELAQYYRDHGKVYFSGSCNVSCVICKSRRRRPCCHCFGHGFKRRCSHWSCSILTGSGR